MKYKLLRPNQVLNRNAMTILVVGWVMTTIIAWSMSPFPMLPKPFDVIRAFPGLVIERELLINLVTSFTTSITAMLIATAISLTLAYTSRIAEIKPLSIAMANIRYLGFAGIAIIFTLTLYTQHLIKIGLLVFGISGFFLKSMYDVVKNIPRDRYDDARTLGMNEWQVLWYVVIRGTLGEAWDIFRQCNAIVWTLLTIVEMSYRSEGGVGVMLANGEKHFDYPSLYGVQITIFLTGFFTDVIIGMLKRTTCPHTALAEKKS